MQITVFTQSALNDFITLPSMLWLLYVLVCTGTYLATGFDLPFTFHLGCGCSLNKSTKKIVAPQPSTDLCKFMLLVGYVRLGGWACEENMHVFLSQITHLFT